MQMYKKLFSLVPNSFVFSFRILKDEKEAEMYFWERQRYFLLNEKQF